MLQRHMIRFWCHCKHNPYLRVINPIIYNTKIAELEAKSVLSNVYIKTYNCLVRGKARNIYLGGGGGAEMILGLRCLFGGENKCH